MKIAIPMDARDMDTRVSTSFGRAPYYLIYDADQKASLFVENYAADSTGGAGIKAAQILVDYGADILLAPRCGENAAEVLLEAKVQLYKTKEASARENLQAFLDGQLPKLQEIHAGFHGGGH